MKVRTDKDFLRVFNDLHVQLNMRGLNIAYMILDNEASPVLQQKLRSKDIYYQLSPPVMHHYNADELSIGTFKYRFLQDSSQHNQTSQCRTGADSYRRRN